jgi:hypothetical protein
MVPLKRVEKGRVELVADIIYCFYEVFVKIILPHDWLKIFSVTVTVSVTLVCYDLAITPT